MKPLLLFLVFAVLALASCGSTSLLERKYRPGFYIDRKSTANPAGHENSHVTTGTVKSQHNPSAPAQETAAVTPPANTQNSFSTAITDSTVTLQPAPLTEKAGATTSPHKDRPVEEEKEKIRKAKNYAILAIVFFVVGAATIVFIVGLGFLLAAFIMALLGLLKARQVKREHPKGERYPGRNAVIFATIIGWIGIGLMAAAIGLLGYLVVSNFL